VTAPKRSVLLAIALLVVAGVVFLGVRHERCVRRNAGFAEQLDGIKRDAHERLKVGANKSEVVKFFDDHYLSFTIVGSEAYGTLRTSGCAPLGCSTNRGFISVRVEFDARGAVAQEAVVVGGYADCV
jgi:hypothetical protein